MRLFSSLTWVQTEWHLWNTIWGWEGPEYYHGMDQHMFHGQDEPACYSKLGRINLMSMDGLHQHRFANAMDPCYS
jgi:hypothetical protein